MSNSFFVFLPSNVTDYPDNQPNKFRVRLPKSLHFNGSWVCGLHSISYPYSWSTIGTLDEQWIDIHFTDIGVPEEDQHRVIRVPVPRSSQNRVEQLRDFLATTLRSHVNAKLKPLPREEEADRNRTKPLYSPPPAKRSIKDVNDLSLFPSPPKVDELEKSPKSSPEPVTPPPASRPRVDESEKSPKSSPEPVTPPASPPRVDDPEEPPKSPPAYVPPTKSVTAPQTPKLESPPPAQTPPAVKPSSSPPDTMPPSATPVATQPPAPIPQPTPPLLPKPSAPPPASTPPKPSSTLPPPPTPTAPKSSAPPTAPTPPKPSAPPPALTSPKPASPPTPVPTPPKPASPPPRIPTPPKPASPLPPVPTPPKPTSPPPPVPTPKPASPPVPTPKAASPQKPPKTKLAPPPPPAQTQPSPVKTTPASKILTAKTIPKPPPRQKTPPPPEIPTRPSISPTLESPPRIDESNRTIVKPSVKESTPPHFAKTFDTTAKEVKPTEPVAAALTQLADLPENTFSFRINPLPVVPRSVSIQYLDDVERFKVSFNDRLIRHLSFSPQLGYVLGFENPQHVVSNEVAKYPVDLRGGISSFAVYSKGLTENMIVGNSLSSLLRVVSVSGATPNDYNEKIYDSPIFARVLPREINEIEIELRTMDKGRLVPFAYGTTLVVLLFKKVINF
ncbi:hypothetical protein niasHT_029186 [Heterodera trifolii]|uniref:Uncharacterized protein n=1 Tax=Heterodera trifolii TaxID=157864 RepID=A0ABD2JUI0_9BILA